MWSPSWNRDSKPLFLRQRSAPSFVVATVSVAIFTDVFLYAVIVPTLPFVLSQRIGIPNDQLQYWVSVSLAVFAAAVLICSPTWGYLADRTVNRRTPMLFGLVLLLATSLLLCFSVNIPMLLTGRVLQGMSAAMVWSVGLALVLDTIDTKRVGEAMGWVGSASSLGMLIAPSLGGVIYARAGYYAVFAVCFSLIGLDVILRLGLIEAKDAKAWLDVDQDREREPLISETDNITAATITTNGVQHEQSQTVASADRSHMTPSHLLRKPRLLAAFFGTIIETGITTSFDGTLPLFVATTFGWNSTGAGLVFLPLAIPTLFGPLVGGISDRYGPKWPATIGSLVTAPLLVCLRFVREDTIWDQVLLCVLLACLGLSMTFISNPLMAEVSWAIEEGQDPSAPVPYALAYGLHSMSFSMGAIIGPVLGGLVRERFGWATMGLTLGLVSLVGAAVEVTWTGGPLRWRRAEA